jgi:hypothetical protein
MTGGDMTEEQPEQTPEQTEPEPVENEEPVAAPVPVDVQDDEAAEQSHPATLDDQDDGDDQTSAPEVEGAPDGEDGGSDREDGGSADD